jgi:hypothetical protein
MNDITKADGEADFSEKLSDEALDRTDFGKICSCGASTGRPPEDDTVTG